MASASAVRKILDESVAWRAFLEAFGPMHRGLAWVEVNDCRAIIGFGSDDGPAQVSPVRVYEVGPHGVRRRIRGRRQFMRRLTLDD